MHVHKVWKKNERRVDMKIYFVVILLLYMVGGQIFAQQPRLSQVDEYLKDTGMPIVKEGIKEKKYNLLATLYDDSKRLILNLPEINDNGIREVIPLGVKLNNQSELKIVKQHANMSETAVCPLYNPSLFSGVSYLLCDSVVYGVILYHDSYSDVKREIEKKYSGFFKSADYKDQSVTVYSDRDYAVKLLFDRVEIYSLFHYPIVETLYPGISHKVWYGPCQYERGKVSIELVFYNQITKENNIQSAFKISYTYPDKEPSFVMKKIRFVFDESFYEFPLEVEYSELLNDGTMVKEHDTRTFVFPEVLRELEHTSRINVELIGEGGIFSYEMPAFQRASIHTAYEYFRWNVTNPMVKYKEW